MPADMPLVRAVARHYWNSVTAPQRGWAIEAVALLGGAKSLLEIGCQSGPNLRALHAVWPQMQLSGLDVNAGALDAGRAFMADEGIADVDLAAGAVPDALVAMASKSVDVVLSVYCLAYLGPDRILDAVIESLRVARRAVVFIEPMIARGADPIERSGADSDYVEWHYDYVSLLDRAMDYDWPGKPERLRVAPIWKPPVALLNGMIIATKDVP